MSYLIIPFGSIRPPFQFFLKNFCMGFSGYKVLLGNNLPFFQNFFKKEKDLRLCELLQTMSFSFLWNRWTTQPTWTLLCFGYFCFFFFSCGTDTTSCMNTPSLFSLVGHLRLHDHILHEHSKLVFFGGTFKTSCLHELAPTPFAS
jgi:hypothetical protein